MAREPVEGAGPDEGSLRVPAPGGPRAGRAAAEAQDDARLLAEIGHGRHDALAALYAQRRGDVLFALLVRILSSPAEAEDVLQETFVQIRRRAAQFDPGRAAGLTWLVMIARGLALDRLRARDRRRGALDAYQREIASLEVEELGAAGDAMDAELAAKLAAALHQLPDEQRRAIELAFYRGWTHEEIAGASGDPLGTVKSRIRRGMIALRQRLKDIYA